MVARRAHNPECVGSNPAAAIFFRTADERAWLALRLIESAQNLINDAAQELCDVRGMCPEWEAASRVHDTIKAYWTRVNTKYQSLKCKGPLQLGDADPASLTSESSRG